MTSTTGRTRLIASCSSRRTSIAVILANGQPVESQTEASALLAQIQIPFVKVVLFSGKGRLDASFGGSFVGRCIDVVRARQKGHARAPLIKNLPYPIVMDVYVAVVAASVYPRSLASSSLPRTTCADGPYSLGQLREAYCSRVIQKRRLVRELRFQLKEGYCC